MTITEITTWLKNNKHSINPNILNQLLQELQVSDNVVLPDVSGVADEDWAIAGLINSGKKALVKVNGVWTLITGIQM